jgi:hypothetical protein
MMGISAKRGDGLRVGRVLVWTESFDYGNCIYRFSEALEGMVYWVVCMEESEGTRSLPVRTASVDLRL